MRGDERAVHTYSVSAIRQETRAEKRELYTLYNRPHDTVSHDMRREEREESRGEGVAHIYLECHTT